MNKTRASSIAKAYIKSKFNGAEAGMQIFNTKKRKNASVMMRKTLQSPYVQGAIQEELAKTGIDHKFINKHFKLGIENNLKYGKHSQAVGAQLLIQAQKIYNYLPKSKESLVKEERKITLDKNFTVIKEELTQSVTTSQELLKDL